MKRIAEWCARIAEGMGLGMYLYHLEVPGDDGSLRMVEVTPLAERITGLARGAVVGRTLDENFPGLREQGVPQLFAKVARTGQSATLGELEYGDERVAKAHFAVRAIPMPDRHVAVLFEDITARKTAEQTARTSSHALSERVKELNCLYAISTVLLRGDLSWDETLQQLVELIPMAWQYPEVACARIRIDGRTFTAAPFAESPWFLTSRIIAREREVGTVEVFYRQERPVVSQGPFLAEEVTLLGEIATRLGDVAYRRQVRNDLRAAKERAERANRMKNQFLANVSHELRTPLNSVLGYTDLLLDGIDGPVRKAQSKSLLRIKRNAQVLLRLINELLDLSRIEAGRLTLDREPFNLRELVREVAGTIGARAKAKQIGFSWSVGEKIPEILVGDGGRVRQVLMNLSENAVKFTDQGGVRIEVAGERQETGEFVPRFTVLDSGAGVPVSQQSQIFEAFFQGDGSLTRSHSGLGLGLALSARLVALMGGRLWVESEAGGGSQFHFTARLGSETPGTGR